MADNTPRIRFKRGESFIYPFVVWKTTQKNEPLDVTNITFKGQLRKGSALVAELEFVKVDAVMGKVTMQFTGDTSPWPAAELLCDIKMTDNGSGQKIISDTFIVHVDKEVTKEGIGTP